MEIVFPIHRFCPDILISRDSFFPFTVGPRDHLRIKQKLFPIPTLKTEALRCCETLGTWPNITRCRNSSAGLILESEEQLNYTTRVMGLCERPITGRFSVQWWNNSLLIPENRLNNTFSTLNFGVRLML